MIRFAAASLSSSAFAGKALETVTSSMIKPNTISDAYLTTDGTVTTLILVSSAPLYLAGTSGPSAGCLDILQLYRTDVPLPVDCTYDGNNKLVFTFDIQAGYTRPLVPGVHSCVRSRTHGTCQAEHTCSTSTQNIAATTTAHMYTQIDA